MKLLSHIPGWNSDEQLEEDEWTKSCGACGVAERAVVSRVAKTVEDSLTHPDFTAEEKGSVFLETNRWMTS